MKIFILAILVTVIFTVNLKASDKMKSARQDFVYDYDSYYAFDNFYYDYSPMTYSYTPSSYYYLCEWWWYPTACDSTYIVYRQNQLKDGKPEKDSKLEKRSLNLEEVKKQINLLKKEIYGKEDFSTTEIRKNNKAYDPRWLLAQLKVSRLLFLEDEMNKNKQNESNISIKKEENLNKNHLDNKV